MAKRFIGYRKYNQEVPAAPVVITGEVNFKDWQKLAGPSVSYGLEIGERYFSFSKDELAALMVAIETALADENQLIDAEIKHIKKYVAAAVKEDK